MILNTLRAAGFVLNARKSVLESTQLVEHLGVLSDFATGVVSIPCDKRRDYRREVGKLVVQEEMILRKGASILGNVRSSFGLFSGFTAFVGPFG